MKTFFGPYLNLTVDFGGVCQHIGHIENTLAMLNQG